MSRFLFYCLLISVTFTTAAYSQGNSANKNLAYTVTKRLVSTEDGLASHEIFCGLQDKDGFLWFGTRNGLNRYDGKSCLLFTRQQNNLQENKVVQLAKDENRNLFIEYGSTGFQLTTIGKVDVMNTLTREVKTLTATFSNLPFKEQDVYWVANDGTNEVNFLTANPFRLWKYSVKDGFKLRYQVKDWNNINNTSAVDYRATGPFCVFAKGNALLKIFNQSTQYLITKDTVVAFTQKDAGRSLPIGFSHENDLLIAYNLDGKVAPFTVGKVNHTGYAEFPADVKNTTADSVNGKYWSQVVWGTDGGSGILNINADALYLWRESAFIKLASKQEIKNAENLFLYQLFTDNFGNFWLCTSLGVLQFKIEKNRFQHYFTNQQQTVELNSQARGIYADDNGKVAANIWRHVFRQGNDKIQNIPSVDIQYALSNHQAKLYSGGYDLAEIDEQKNVLTNYASGKGSEIWSLFSLNDSLLLLGRSDGFLLFNANNKTFDSLNYQPATMAGAKFVYRFFKAGTDTIWAVADNGLYKIFKEAALRSSNGRQWSVIRQQSATIDQLGLLDAYADSNGIFWLATNGQGLYRWDRNNNSFRQLTITSGFPSDVLYRIEPDNYDNLWISSDYGLVRFNKKTFSINTYTIADGISNNEFNRTSSFKSKNGTLFFGGLDGINAFYPAVFITDTSSFNPPLRIIAFNQFTGKGNRLVNKTSGLLQSNQIELAPNDQFFTLEFQLLNFEKEDAPRYAYKIEGIDKDWNYINENSIRISGLPYGKFTLHLKAQNHEGAWSKSELMIPLTVLKPFYLEWWFIAAAILSLLIIIYWIIKTRTNQLGADKNKLEQTVNERTLQLKQSLAEQHELLAEKDVLMKEIHHRVKNNLQVISGLLELQSKTLDDKVAKEALQEGRNRVRSMALIHQNLYQFENLSAIELKRFANDLCRQVESVFKRQTRVELNVSVPELYLDIDSAVPLGLIMNELLTNSFKYAFTDNPEGKIDLKIHELTEGKYMLTYFDNGPGLPAGFNPKQANTLGLQLINDLSRQIGGTVHYEYQNGSTFTIYFTNRNLRKNKD